MNNFKWMVVLSLLLPQIVFAAEISRPSEGVIRLHGEIVSGDADRLEALLYSSPEAFIETGLMEVDSPGGDIGEAMRIARIVEDSRITVVVEEHARCASACFIVVASASFRLSSGKVAVHRPYLPQSAHADASISFVAEAQMQASRVAEAFLRERSVPQALLDHMVSTPSNRAYVLRFTDLQALGVFPPAWEEVLISRCSLSNEDAISGSASDEQWSCARDIAVRARLELVFRNYSPEVAREIMRQMLLDAGGVELRGGDIAFDPPADSAQEDVTPQWDSLEPVESVPEIDDLWEKYVDRARAKQIEAVDPKDSTMRLMTLYNDILPRLSRRGDADAAFRLGMIADNFGLKSTALSHFRNASELGEPLALMALGLAHQFGGGDVDVDKPRALAYYALAERHGVDRATEMRTALASELQPSDIERARNLEARIGSTLPVQNDR